MPLFRFVMYFAALTACAVVAFPYWAPADTERSIITAESDAMPVTDYVQPKKAVTRYRAPQTTRLASRD